jgi:hypothetical protein
MERLPDWRDSEVSKYKVWENVGRGEKDREEPGELI